MRRRQFLIGAGSTACVLVGAGAWVSSRDIEKARAPWRLGDRTFDDPRLHALAHAILAPNPHNRQPWLVELRDDDRIIL
ncbi:MAG: twin-arginine translocation pathway signal protein, partial [Pseudomonadota bacterium]